MWEAFLTAVAVLIAGMGFVAVAAPRVFLDGLDALDVPSRLWLIATLRLIIGASLFIVAPDTAHPEVFRGLGALTVLAAVALPILGGERIARVVEWWKARPPLVLRIWGGAAAALGVFLLWSMRWA
jgi:hypothetical protein